MTVSFQPFNLKKWHCQFLCNCMLNVACPQPSTIVYSALTEFCNTSSVLSPKVSDKSVKRQTQNSFSMIIKLQFPCADSLRLLHLCCIKKTFYLNQTKNCSKMKQCYIYEHFLWKSNDHYRPPYYMPPYQRSLQTYADWRCSGLVWLTRTMSY